jgi:hypothetical protein
VMIPLHLCVYFFASLRETLQKEKMLFWMQYLQIRKPGKIC